ncbi:MAG: adenylate/guanylate cyclase domain-containing protein, partial [Sphaerospermopsis sp. SIO1G2]|nr:adenylate/guanylate cyclase domain-containing protein [Sphaerospermopsis sp. SIO1G2]
LQKDSVTEVGLGDHVSKEMAVIFSDIRGFTSISEKLGSQENFDFVNGYWQAISPYIREHRGIIVKYLGDGMMAMFEHGVDDALRASIAKMKEVQRFSQSLVAQGLPEINIGVGINFGRLMFGIIGEENRMQGDAFSDEVNTAARVEGLTKFYGVSIILTELAYRALDTADSYRLRYLDQIVVKGRAEPIAIYEVLDGLPDEVLAQKWGSIESFMVARDDYVHGRLESAVEKFSALVAQYPADRVFALYRERVLFLQERGLPEGWNGVWQMAQK